MKSQIQESFLKTKLKTFIPFKVQKFLYKYIKKYRIVRNKTSNSFNKGDIKNFLTNAGIEKGDVIMVHSSLSRIGFVEGGVNTLIGALIDVIGDKGTMVMPTFSSPNFNDERGEYEFDVNKTEAYTGKVPDTFRKMKGVERSLSPLHSVAVFGEKKDWFVKDHEKCDNGYSMEGPFGKLYESDAKIVLIGVDQLANSSIHIVENKCKFPIEVFSEALNGYVTDKNGDEVKVKFKKHLPHLYKVRKNNIMEKYLLKDKLMDIFPMGNTEIRVMKVKDFVHCMEGLLAKGVTIYNQ